MTSPLPGADYLRPPKRSGTKEEVLAMLREHVANGCKLPSESREERMERKLRERHESHVWHENTFAGPRFVPVGPMQPTRQDERFKDYRGRYGQVLND